jgi:hypothetical protein
LTDPLFDMILLLKTFTFDLPASFPSPFGDV